MFQSAYKELVPVAQDNNVKIAMHPSDTPHPDSPFGGLGLHRILMIFQTKMLDLFTV